MTNRRRIDIGRFVAAVIALVTVVVVAPVVLGRVASVRFGAANPLHGVRAPWDSSAAEMGDALGDPLSDDTVVDALIRVCLCVAWAAIAVVAVTTVVEVVHMVRHRGLAMPTMRGVGWAQGIARYIAVGLLVVMPLASAKPSLATTRAPSTGPWPEVATLVVTPAETGPVQTPAPQPATPTTYTVQRGDSVFSIAAELVGHDERRTMDLANDILDANLGALMSDGQRFTNPAYVEPGWVLLLPVGVATVAAAPATADGATSYVVEQGDTLWDIADEASGSGTAWVEIWEANAGQDMGGGRTFDDPDLILPGWELELPHEPAPTVEQATAEGPPAPTPPDAPPRVLVDAPVDSELVLPAADDRAPSTIATAGSTPGAAPTTAFERATLPESASGVPVPTVAPPSTTSTTAVPAGATDQPAGAPPERGVAPDAPSPIRIEHAAMLAAGILTLVGVRRRQRLRHARPRGRVPEPRPDVIETELLLRRIDPGERGARVDVACRSAAFALIDTDVQIVVVQVSPEGGVVLTLSGPAPAPSPWTVVDAEAASTRWSLAAGIPIELLTDQARRVGMPCVALAQLGIDEGGNDVLVDLEACGILAIEAHPAQADAVVRALAAGLATSPYAEVAHLITVSISNDVLLGHRNAHRTDSIDAAFDLAASLVGSTSTNERSSFELRSLRTGGEMWEPAVIFLQDADGASSALAPGQQPSPGHGIALATAVGPGELQGAPARLTGRTDRWTLAVMGQTIPMTPIGLDRADVDAVVAILHDAEQPLIWLDDLTDSGDARDPVHAVDAPAEDAVVGGGPADGEPQDRIRDGSPFEPMDHAIVVRLLGGVDVTDVNGVPGQFERSKTVELIAWLATHRAHSTRNAARTALWELDVRDATFANVVSEARRALGRLVPPPAGEEWLARTLTAQLPLHPLVVTDAQLIEERLEKARLEPPARAIDTLRPAVEMVTGMPFADTSYLWPDAEGITSSLVLLAISAAAEVAGHALSIGDTELVFWATARGLAVLPGHEELIALRMRAHARTGDLAAVRQEWESYERVIVADPWSDGEPAAKLLDLRRELLTNSGD